MVRQAVIVPSTTDLNRGDQALAWEAVRMLEEMGFGRIYSIDNGESREQVEFQTAQSRSMGLTILRRILPHPRRGSPAKNKVRESIGSLVLMSVHGLRDAVRGLLLITIAKHPHLVRFLLSDDEFRTYLTIRESDAVVVKGGGFLHAYGGLASSYYIWYQLFYLQLAHRLAIPVVVLPNSYGPFDGPLVKWQLSRVLSRCAFVSARESISAQVLLDDLGIVAERFPDMGYFLKAADAQVGQEICRQHGIPLGVQECVGFTVRPYRFPGEIAPNRAYERYLDAVADLIKYIALVRNMYPVLVTQVAGPSAHENDRLAIQELRHKLDDLPHAWVDIEDNCRVLKSVYGCLDYVVGTRFHSVVFAQDNCTACLAIAYGGNKATGIMHDIGMDDFVLPIETVTGERLIERFNLLVQREPEVQCILDIWRQENRKQRDKMIRMIRFSLFGEKRL